MCIFTSKCKTGKTIPGSETRKFEFLQYKGGGSGICSFPKTEIPTRVISVLLRYMQHFFYPNSETVFHMADA